MKTKNINNHHSFLNINGDLFTSIENRLTSGKNGATIIVPHVCNNVNLFGAGFAAALAQKYPIVKDNYHLLGPSFLKSNMGYSQFIDVEHKNSYKHRLIFVNMIAQNNIRSDNNKRPLNYVALSQCMLKVKHFIANGIKLMDSGDSLEIHCPKFGSGLSGGNWNFISELIDDIWSKYTVFVYHYGQKN